MGYLDEWEDYLDPNETVRGWARAGFGTNPIETYKLLRDKGLSAYTDLVGVPKRALDIVGHEIEGTPGPIRPSEEVLTEALYPNKSNGPTPSLIGEAMKNSGLSEAFPELKVEDVDPNSVETGLKRGITRTAGRIVTDPALPAMGIGGLPGKVVAGAFVPEMAKGAGTELGTALAEGVDQGDIPGAVEHGVGGLADLTMAGLASSHATKGLPEVVGKALPDVMSKEVVWEAPREPVPITKQEIPNPNPEVITTSADVNNERIVNTKTRTDKPSLTPEDDFYNEALGIEPDKPEVTPNPEEVGSVTPKSDYLAVKPLLEKALEYSPFEYDPNRLGMGLGGIKGKGPKDTYEGPYANVEKDIEETLGPEATSEPSVPTEPIPSTPKERVLPTIVPKEGIDLKTAIDNRAKEIRSLVVGIDPVKARKLAMLDIAREQGNKSKEVAVPETKASIPEEKNPSEIESIAAEIKAKPAKEMKAIEEPSSLPKSELVKEEITPKKYTVVMEDGSTHKLRGPSEEKVRSFAEEKFGSKVRSLEERVKSGKQVQEGKPLESEIHPNETSLFDDITDLPKTLKSSWDISFPLRQGYFLLNRGKALRSMARGTKSGLGEKYHLDVQKNLSERPNAELYTKFGLNQIKYDPTELGQISEQMPLTSHKPTSKFAAAVQKIPGLKQSERMFTDSGNLVRADMFDHFLDKWSKEGKTPEARPDLYHGLAKYLNVLTGRDPLPKKLQQAGYILNKIFWSPQYVKSRLQLLNPGFYYKLPREVQKEAIRDVGGTLATTATLLSAVNYAAKQSGNDDEIKVSWDPTNSNFGKLKYGKTTYDFFTGLTPIIRTASRIATSRKSTPKGEYQLPGGFGLASKAFETPTEYLPVAPFGQSAGAELGHFVEGKAAPGYQIGKGVLTGKNYYGEPYELPDFLSDVAEPMSAGDIIYSLRNYDAMEGLKALPGLLGVGVQVERVPKDFSQGGFPYKKKSRKKKQLLF